MPVELRQVREGGGGGDEESAVPVGRREREEREGLGGARRKEGGEGGEEGGEEDELVIRDIVEADLGIKADLKGNGNTKATHQTYCKVDQRLCPECQNQHFGGRNFWWH